MTTDPLQEFGRLREAMLRRKAEIETELQALQAVLGGKPLPVTGPVAPAAAREKPKRVRNAMSLGDAVFSATKDAPLSKEEILAALTKQGYRFSDSASPMEEVGSVLQMDKRFEHVSGKYGPTLAALFPET